MGGDRKPPLPSGRTLSDEDIEALVTHFTEQFYKALGKGLWGAFQKAFIAIVLAVVIYGYVKGIK